MSLNDISNPSLHIKLISKLNYHTLAIGAGWSPFILNNQTVEGLPFLNAIGELPDRRCWVGGTTNVDCEYISYPEDYMPNFINMHEHP